MVAEMLSSNTSKCVSFGMCTSTSTVDKMDNDQSSSFMSSVHTYDYEFHFRLSSLNSLVSIYHTASII